MPFGSYSSTPSANTSIAGNNISEGGPPSAINNAIRQLMADARLFSDSVPATQVILAAATQGVYPNAAGAYVPRGLTQASVGAVTPGSGGTNGTFDLTWTGGNFAVNPTGTFTVTGGALASVNITGPGQYIGLAANPPVPGFGGSLGLSGAAVVLTAQTLVASGVGYWVVRAGGEWLDRYVNNSGAALKTPAVSSIYLADLSGVNAVANVLGSVLSVADNMPAVLAAPAAADLARRWAESTSPPADISTMSAKSWAMDAKATRNSFPNYFKGDDGTPGVNGGVGSSAGFASLFAAANGMAVGAGITRLQLSGSDEAGLGGPQVIHDAAVTTATRDANPLTQFIAADGRGFKLDPNQRLSPGMFGANTTKTGAQNLTALRAAVEYQPATNNKYTPHQELGPGVYNISGTLEPEAVFTLGGQGGFYDNGGAVGGGTTRIIAPANTTIVRIKVNSTGDVLTPGSINAGGSTIKNLRLEQATGGTDRNAHGVHARGTVAIENSVIRNISGDAINITAAFDGGPSTYGNANSWHVVNVQTLSDGNGLCLGSYKGTGGGADTNAGYSLGLNVQRAGRGGLLDFSYYGNSHIAAQFNETGQTGVWYGGFTWQLMVERDTGTVPGSNGNWYKLRAQASADSNFPTWNSGTEYVFTGPTLASAPSIYITPYQENQRTLGHVPNGLVVGGNMRTTQLTPTVRGKFGVGFICNMGMGHYRSVEGDTAHPAYPFIGDEEHTYIGAPGPSSGDLHKRARLFDHRVMGFDWVWDYQNVVGGVERDIFSTYGGRIQWSISGAGTARNYGRTASVEGVYTLHDHGIIDTTNSNNARIHGMRDAAPSGSYYARGEFYWNVNPGGAGGVLGWATTASGTPGTQTPVRIYDQLPAQADLAPDATLATMVAAHNALLAKLRTGGFMAAS